MVRDIKRTRQRPETEYGLSPSGGTPAVQEVHDNLNDHASRILALEKKKDPEIPEPVKQITQKMQAARVAGMPRLFYTADVKANLPEVNAPALGYTTSNGRMYSRDGYTSAWLCISHLEDA